MKSDAHHEEEYLFALTHASVQEHLDVSFSRTDYRGRPLSPSPLLRPLGKTPADRHVTPHPLEELEFSIREAPLLLPQEALLLTGLKSAAASEDVRDLARTLDLDPSLLEPGLQMIQCTEAWRDQEDRFDGRFGPPDPARPWSARSLQMLAKCPLQYGFAYRLRLRPEPEPEEDAEYSPLEMGILVHEVLEELYRSFADVPAAERREHARRTLPALWAKAEAAAVGRPLPAPVRAVRAEVWQDAILRFVDQDLARLDGRGATIHECEVTVETDLDLGDDVTIPVVARIDRVLRLADGTEALGDYKTGSPVLLAERVKDTGLVRGQEPQLPLYWLTRQLGGDTVQGAEYIAVGPRAVHAGPDATYVPLGVQQLQNVLPRLVETWRGLVLLAQNGRYPLNSASSPAHRGEGACGRCDYRRICRHTHQPTILRNESDPDAEEYYQHARQHGRPARGAR